MRKLLSLLSAIALTSASRAGVIACGSRKKPIPPIPIPLTSKIDILK